MERMEFEFDLHFYPISEPGLLESFPHLNKEAIQKEVHLIIDNEERTSLHGADVIRYLARHNEAVKKYSWLLDTDVGQKASEIFYQSVNKLRESLHNHCPKCKTR